MRAKVTLIGNEGFLVTAKGCSVCVDAYCGIRGLVSPSVPPDDLILVTHAHWDHFDATQVADAAKGKAAKVIGPRSVIRQLKGRLAASSLIELEPPLASPGGMACCQRAELPGLTVTAFRTFHSRDHNSYLVEMPGFRFFHDGDNEDTRRLDTAAIGRLDALLIGPWQGSGWVEFIEKLAPERYFLMHLTEEELAQHDAGKFLPEICDHVPEGLVVLRPGESYIFA